ncbi:hypothetical protein, partial [Pseudomonas poae]|uniref:hypothetical protein n=1 Tax=Pseudomonas poae TaxID=200451 RepID=UPI0034D5900B
GRISEIRLRTGGCVDSIRITRTDASRTKHHSETYGGDGGSAHTVSPPFPFNTSCIAYILILTSLFHLR